MRFFFIYISLFIVATASAQLKYDNNWVFGQNAGIDFENGTVFESKTCNLEAAASISHPITGELLLYYSDTADCFNGNGIATISNANGTVIQNGDSIIIYSSCANCAMFLPTDNDSVFYFVHIGSTCLGYCNQLYYTVIAKTPLGHYRIIKKNISIGSFLVGERFAAYLSADNKRWRIVTHAIILSGNTNVFYSAEIQNDGTVTLDSQFVGPAFFDFDITGEQSVSANGKMMVLSSVGGEFVNIYGIDRCSGTLTFIEQISNLGEVYGVEFSPSGRYLYVQDNNLTQTNITQYDIEAVNIGASGISLLSVNVNRGANQMQLSPNGELIVADALDRNSLDVIPFPNSQAPACGFLENEIQLDSASLGIIGLPNMPNYNMPPSGVFAAQAGNGDTLCASSGSVTLGVAQQPHILYQWQANATLSNTTIAQPVATPTQDTWYYLTVTDTTSVSCAVNVDSVFVKVENCVGVAEPNIPKLSYRIFPNPVNGNRTAQVTLGAEEVGEVRVYDLAGRLVGQYTITEGVNTLDITQAINSTGIYIYKVIVNDNLVRTDKLVVVE